jgi:tRNA(His) 5'-end guanylyltransferase
MSELPQWQRRGIGLYKKDISINGYNPINKENVISNRSKIYNDWKLPLFDNEFFNKILN